MKIRYTGTAGIRIIDPYRWDSSNGYVQDVTDPDMLLNLLTYPKPEFESVEEPGQLVDKSTAQPVDNWSPQLQNRRRPAKRKE